MTEKITVPHFHLEAERRGASVRFLVFEALSVSEFSPESVRILLRGGGIALRGERLTVAVFERQMLAVTGRIQEVEIFYDPS